MFVRQLFRYSVHALLEVAREGRAPDAFRLLLAAVLVMHLAVGSAM